MSVNSPGGSSNSLSINQLLGQSGIPAGGSASSPGVNFLSSGSALGSSALDVNPSSFQLSSGLQAEAQKMGGNWGADGVQIAETMLKSMLMQWINTSNDSSNQFVQALQDANPDNQDDL